MSFKSYIRRWLGIDEIIERQDVAHTEHTLRSFHLLADSVEQLSKKLTDSLEAGAQLEASIERKFESSQIGHEERVAALRAIIYEARNDSRAVRSEMHDKQKVIDRLSAAVNRLEFPGFEPIKPN